MHTDVSDPVMVARYGLDRRHPFRAWAVAAVIGVYLAGAVWAALGVSRTSVEGNVLGWRTTDRSAVLTLEVRGATDGAVECVVKATDSKSTDVGYRTVTIPRSPTTAEVTLPTVIRASSVTVLGCVPQGQNLRVAPPDFPPGVTIP